MNLISCPDCNHSVSAMAKYCPACGGPIKGRTYKFMIYRNTSEGLFHAVNIDKPYSKSTLDDLENTGFTFVTTIQAKTLDEALNKGQNKTTALGFAGCLGAIGLFWLIIVLIGSI